MRTNIEREIRFILLDWKREITKGLSPLDIVQGYVENINPTISGRVRIIDGKKAVLTKKEGVGKERIEKEIHIGQSASKAFLEICSHIIYKKRFIPTEEQPECGQWTIDIFDSPLKGLVIAELEFYNEEQKFVLPSWIIDAVEVTDSISNLPLARLATQLKNAGLTTFSYDQLITKKIPRIVLTGGPCCGKTAITKMIKKEAGDIIHCVPEAATILIEQIGVKPNRDAFKSAQFNLALYQIQKIFESASIQDAINYGKRAWLSDRGRIDNAAYMPNGLNDFERVCTTNKLHEYNQYDTVIYLGMPSKEIYDEHRFNNPARTETYEEAVILGENIKNVWSSHKNFIEIPGSINWEEKLRLAKKIILEQTQ